MANKLRRVLTEPWSEKVQRTSANGLVVLFSTAFGIGFLWSGSAMVESGKPSIVTGPRGGPPIPLNVSDTRTLGVIAIIGGAVLLFAPLAYWFWNSLKR